MEKQNMKTLWKQGGSSNAPASPPATAKKGKRRGGGGGKCQKSPLKANFTQQKEKHFKSYKAEKTPKW